MFRFLFRLLALFLLAFAVMYVVIDASSSIAGGGLSLTQFQTTFFQLMPGYAEQFMAWSAAELPDAINDPILATALKAPTSLVAAVVAFLFYALSRKTKRSIGRFSLD